MELSSPDGEALLVNWLNELLYLHDVEGAAPSRIEIEEVTETRLRATLGGRLERSPELVAHEVKAATFHGLRLTRNEDGYSATVIFDI